MLKIMVIVAVVILALHGLIHLMGTAAYLKLATIQELPYKTTLLGGQWEVGEGGMALYGMLWAVAALGFIIASLAFWFGWGWWQPMLIGVSLFSLVLTALDWQVAFAGVFVNLLILAMIGLRSPLSRWLAS